LGFGLACDFELEADPEAGEVTPPAPPEEEEEEEEALWASWEGLATIAGRVAPAG
jgi:hypothetical protein